MNLKRRKKKSLAQQSKQILILMTVILVIILGGCTYVLNKTSGQIYEQMSQMAQLYAQELDNRFLRISRNLFSTIMDTKRDKCHILGKCQSDEEWGLFGVCDRKTQRRIFFFSMGIWNGIQDFFITQTIRIN